MPTLEGGDVKEMQRDLPFLHLTEYFHGSIRGGDKISFRVNAR